MDITIFQMQGSSGTKWPALTGMTCSHDMRLKSLGCAYEVYFVLYLITLGTILAFQASVYHRNVVRRLSVWDVKAF